MQTRKFFLLYDYPHLFKSVRNCLLKNNIRIIDDIISWGILAKLYAEDSKNVFQVCFKLTKSHINPNNFEKLSVKLATQVFSANVAAGVFNAIASNCYETEADKKIATSTATFLCKMNCLFDHLNTSNFNSNNPNRQPISSYSETLQSIKTAREWISLWEATGKMKKPYCFSGLLQTLLGIELIWDAFGNDQQFLLVAHLNTDVAENLFSMARSNRGSYERNPSAYRFVRNLKQIIFQNLKSSENAGYEDAGAESLLKDGDCDELKYDESAEFHTEAPIEDHLLGIDITTNIEYDVNGDDDLDGEANETNQIISKKCSEKLQEAAVTFYAGFAAFKLQKKLNCENCTLFMIDKSGQYREQAILIKLKAYDTYSSSSEFGKLTVPSVEFEAYVKNVQACFETQFTEVRHEDHLIDKLLTPALKVGTSESWKCSNDDHRHSICKFILIGLVKFSIKKTNKDFCGSNSVRT